MELLLKERTPVLFFAVLSAVVGWCFCAAPYFGTSIGPFKKFVHDVEGDVYAVDDKTIFIKGFSYDGQGPDAFFWGGDTSKPDATGFIIPDETGKKEKLGEYRNRNLLLRLPPGKTLRNIKWISVWCRKFNANFGEIFIPRDLVIPQPIEIGRIPTKEHGVSSGPVMIVDTQTLLVPEFTYDGLGPAAFWWVSRGAKQHPRGTRLADENGRFAPLPRFTGKTVVITLPDEKTIYDYDWFGVWCEEARVDFGSVQLPQDVAVPPSPRMLGIELEYKLNCEVLHDDLGFEVRWIMDGEDVVMQLVAKLEPNEYMSFGLSKNDSASRMINADAAVAWVDRNRRGHAVDYFLGSKEQCVGQRGSCPDVRHSDGTDSVTLLNAATVNGYTMITFKRPQVGLDEKYDQHIYSDGPQAVVWAIGPLNNRDEVSYHGILRSEGDVFVDFARPPQWNCPQPENPTAQSTSTPRPTTTTTTKKPSRKPSTSTRGRKPKPTSAPLTHERRRKPFAAASQTSSRISSTKSGWKIPKIVCPADRTFRAQIGPAGGKKGYQSITGDIGWGVAWYIDGILIPELTVQRGKTYTFIVEGGYDPENSARQHPLYITDDAEGGFEHKSMAEKKKARLYGGVVRDRRGGYSPTAVGRLCEYKLPSDLSADDFDTFEEFQQNLEMKCERGKQGKLIFKPDSSTPDVVYYQCYTHRYLGWKINVVDSCTETTGGLEYGASVSHVKNITVNGLHVKSESDYKRGPAKHQLTNHHDVGPYEFRPVSLGNDGIPLDLYGDADDDDFAEPEYVPSYSNMPSTEYTTKKTLYYTPTSKYTAAPKKQYYPRQSTTQSSLKILYYPSATSRPFSASTKRPTLYVKHPSSGSTSNSRNKQPQQAFSIRHYTLGSTTQQPQKQQNFAASHLPRQQGPVKVNHKKPTTKPTALRVVMYTSPPPPRKVTTRFDNPWWKPIKEQAAFANTENRQKAVQSLRSQLTAIQSKPAPAPVSAPAPTGRKRPVSINFQNGFLPIVIKNNGSFDRSVVDIPHSIPVHQIAKLASSTNHVPVLVNTRSESVRRENNAKPKTKGFIKTPVGHFPFPISPPKRKSAGVPSAEAFSAFLPLLLPKGKMNNGSKNAAAGTKPSSPVIPIVVPEKKGNNLYILHHVLSLITDDRTKSGRTIKIVDAGTGDKSFVRSRRARSADHHDNHVGKAGMEGDDHHHHDHKHEKSTKNGCTMLAPSLLCFVTGIVLILLI